MGKLGQVLVARGWITVQQLTRALQNQQGVGGRLGTCLLETDALSEDNLQKGLSEQLGVPAVVPEELRAIPEEVLALVPEKLARRCRAVPFRVLGGRLDVAMQDPRNLSCQDEIAFASGKRVKVFVTPEVRMYELLERYYGDECPSRYGLLLDRLNRVRYLWKRPPEPEMPTAAVLTPLGPSFERAPILAAPPLPEPALPPTPLRGAREPRSPLPPLAQVELKPARPAAPAAGGPRPKAPEWPSPTTLAPRMEEAPPLTLITPLEELARPAEPVFGTVVPPPMAIPPAAPAPPAPAAAAVPEAPAAAPAVVEPPRAPARPPRVELTAAEKADLGVPARPLPAFQTAEEFDRALDAANDREEIGRLLLGYLRRDYRRAALFQIHRDRVSGWMADGEGLLADAFGRFSIDFRQPSVFLNLKQGSGMHLGPLPPMPVHRELALAWGGGLPKDAVMLPVRLKDRLVAVLYAEGGGRGQAIDLEPLKRLADRAAQALERAILTRKRSSPQP